MKTIKYHDEEREIRIAYSGSEFARLEVDTAYRGPGKKHFVDGNGVRVQSSLGLNSLDMTSSSGLQVTR
jgi:hypothetical protein